MNELGVRGVRNRSVGIVGRGRGREFRNGNINAGLMDRQGFLKFLHTSELLVANGGDSTIELS